MHPTETFSRFIYLNLYAFLLLLLGIGILVIPCYLWTLWLLPLQLGLAIYCFYGAANVFKGHKDKKRKYDVLVGRNKDGLREDLFTEYMNAPCGRLLVWLVLKDLGYNRKTYRELRKKLWKPFDYKPRKTVVRMYVNNEKVDIIS